MTVETVIGPTAPASLEPTTSWRVGRALARAGGQPDRLAVLAVTYELARDRRVVAQHPTQLADHAAAAAVIEVHVLARQGRAPAVGAALAGGLERADAATQEVSLELLDVGHRCGHRHRFSPPAGALLP